MKKSNLFKAFCLGGLLALVSIVTGCGGVPVKDILPDEVWFEATGSGSVRVGVDRYPPFLLEHEGDLEVFWAIGQWPPKIVSSDAEQCARVEWLFLQHESEGCDE